MCFVLYIGTSKPLPVILWNETTRAIHTEPLSVLTESVRTQFRNPYIYYIGSDTYCGCGFRYTRLQNGSWPEEEWRDEEDTSHIEAQPNHEGFVEFIRTHVELSASFELYGAWESVHELPPLSVQQIRLERLLDLDFYFRDRGHYTVQMS